MSASDMIVRMSIFSMRACALLALGAASRQADGRFVAHLPTGLPPGQYTASAAVFLDGNTLAADIGRVTFRKD
jgi:hypothetical protein